MKEQRPDLFISEGVDAFMSSLLKVFKEDEIRMVALYGSAAKGTFICGFSDIQLFVVLNGPLDAQLVKLSSYTARAIQQYRILPMLMSEAELNESTDIYTMEYIELKHTARIIHGEDLFEALVIDRDLYRHQIEMRMRGSIMTLRQMLLQIEGRRRPLTEFLNQWCDSQDSLFRALIIIKDEKHTEDILEESFTGIVDIISDLYGISSSELAVVYTFSDSQDLRLIDQDTVLSLLKIYEALTGALENMGRK